MNKEITPLDKKAENDLAGHKWFWAEDVKEFIKILKSEANRLLSEGSAIVMNDVINFRAGEELCKK